MKLSLKDEAGKKSHRISTGCRPRVMRMPILPILAKLPPVDVTAKLNRSQWRMASLKLIV